MKQSKAKRQNRYKSKTKQRDRIDTKATKQDSKQRNQHECRQKKIKQPDIEKVTKDRQNRMKQKEQKEQKIDRKKTNLKQPDNKEYKKTERIEGNKTRHTTASHDISLSVQLVVTDLSIKRRQSSLSLSLSLILIDIKKSRKTQNMAKHTLLNCL